MSSLSYCARIPAEVRSESSASPRIFFSQSKCAKTGEVVNAFFILSKACWQSSDQPNLIPWPVKAVNARTMLEKLFMNAPTLPSSGDSSRVDGPLRCTPNKVQGSTIPVSAAAVLPHSELTGASVLDRSSQILCWSGIPVLPRL